MRRAGDERKLEKKVYARIAEAVGPATARSIRSWFQADNVQLDLITVAAFDALELGRRTRRRDRKRLVQAMRKENPRLSKAECAKFAASDAEWMNYYATTLGNSEPRWKASENRCCISKVFPHITRRMGCYWRKHPAYDTVSDNISRFAVSARWQSTAGVGGRPTYNEREAERLSRKGSSPSSWREPRFL